MAKATILHPGFYCSIQDLGRLHFRNIGVPQSGAMDMETAARLNKVLGNDPNAAVLEMITIGATVRFEALTTVAISNNTEQALLNDSIVDGSTAIRINSGDELKVGRATYGNFIYLAVKEGWQTESVLGSRSMYGGITKKGRLGKGDFINYDERNQNDQDINLPTSILRELDDSTKRIFEGHSKDSSKNLITVFEGPEFELLNNDLKNYFFNTEFQISKSWNRMAFRIQTFKKNDLRQIKTAPVQPGTIQLTPDGDLLILMRDAQTTGGYPRILQLADSSINTLSQLQPCKNVQLVKKIS